MNPDLVTRMAPTEGTPFIRLVTVADKNPLVLDFRNGKVLDGADLEEYYVSGLDDEPANWDDIDLEDAFDLPPVLPPVRLPEEPELAAQARRSALLDDLRALADGVRKTMVQTAIVNPVLLRLAEEAELVERDGEDLAPGEDAGWLDDLADDSDVLDAWEYTFAEVLDTTLEVADDIGSRRRRRSRPGGARPRAGDEAVPGPEGRRSDHRAGRRPQGCRDGRLGGGGGRQAVAGVGRCPR